MKYLNFSNSIFILLLSIFISGCVPDECATIICLNDGICESGTCECPVGFSGPTCEVEGTGACANISCENGGTCVSGACECPEGFDGEFCQNEINADPCADVNCQNGGTCDNGTCECADNYEGTLCQSLEREKFIGSYDVTDNCSGQNFTYVMTITAGSSNDKINITNMGDIDGTFSATVDGTDFEFNGMASGNTIIGDGYIDANTLTFGFDSTGSYPLSCSSVGTRQ